MPVWDHRVMNAVAALPVKPPTAAMRNALTYIAAHADFADGVGQMARPSVEATIAPQVPCSVRHAWRLVRALRAGGWIKAVGLWPIEGGRYNVIYSVALDDAQRLVWQAEIEGTFDAWSDEMLPVLHVRGESGHSANPPDMGVMRPTTSTSKPTAVLRTAGAACGVAEVTIVQENPVLAIGKIEENDPDDNPRRKRSAPDDGPSGGVGRLDPAEAAPVAQKGAQRRRGGIQGELAAHFIARQMQVNPNKRSNIADCAQLIAKQLKKTGVDPKTVERMIDAYWDDPRVRSNLRPTQYPHLHFINVVWEDLLLRVERTTVKENYETAPGEQSAKLRRLGIE